MNVITPAKSRPLALAILRDESRRAFVRVARVAVVQLYDAMHAAAVEENASRVAHFIAFDRLASWSRRASVGAKLRRAIAEERARRERQTDLFRPSGMVSSDFSSAAPGSPADSAALAKGRDEAFSK